MSYVLINEPPKTSSAMNIDNPEEPTVQVATPQAVSEPKKPQPAKEKARLAKATAPKPKPISYPQGCENYVQLIQQYFGNYAHIAVKVAQAESGCNPLAVGDDYPINGLYAPSCGLFQIRTLQGRPSCEQLKNPETNVQWAHKLFLSSGWQPWTVCNHGIVSCY